MLHKYDPENTEVEKELHDHLENLSTVTYDIDALSDDGRVVDMRLWNLLDDSLCNV